MRQRRPRAACARGLSLIEMLVAITLGLFLVATTAGFFASQIAEHRRVLLDTRVSQDLRGAVDLLVRDLRRAGQWGHAARAAATAAAPAAGLASAPLDDSGNVYAGLVPAPGSTGSRVAYTYSRESPEDDVVTTNERFGLRINPNSAAVDWRTSGAALAPLDSDTWQALTDPALVRALALQAAGSAELLDLSDRCEAQTCAAGSTDCPPRLSRAAVVLELTLAAVAEPALRRTARVEVRPRNPVLQGRCPTP
jgi:type IV pilus assembly protein PilW